MLLYSLPVFKFFFLIDARWKDRHLHLLKSVNTNEHFPGFKKGVEVAGIWWWVLRPIKAQLLISALVLPKQNSHAPKETLEMWEWQ